MSIPILSFSKKFPNYPTIPLNNRRNTIFISLPIKNDYSPMKKLTKNGIAFFNSRRSSSKKRGNFSSYSSRTVSNPRI